MLCRHGIQKVRYRLPPAIPMPQGLKRGYFSTGGSPTPVEVCSPANAKLAGLCMHAGRQGTAASHMFSVHPDTSCCMIRKRSTNFRACPDQQGQGGIGSRRSRNGTCGSMDLNDLAAQLAVHMQEADGSMRVMHQCFKEESEAAACALHLHQTQPECATADSRKKRRAEHVPADAGLAALGPGAPCEHCILLMLTQAGPAVICGQKLSPVRNCHMAQISSMPCCALPLSDCRLL